jgi:hypothetical protein
VPLDLPKSKAGIASVLVGLGLLILGIGHLLQGETSQAFADFAGAAGTLGLPSIFKGASNIIVSPGEPPFPVTIETPGPVTVVETPAGGIRPTPPGGIRPTTPGGIRPIVEVRTQDEH